jgi:hypothetical protein
MADQAQASGGYVEVATLHGSGIASAGEPIARRGQPAGGLSLSLPTSCRVVRRRTSPIIIGGKPLEFAKSRKG